MSALKSVATRIVEITAEIGVLQQEKEALTAHLLRNLAPGSRTPAGDLTINVSKPVERLNTARLTQAFPVTDRPDLYKPIIDTAKVKQAISTVDLQALGVFDVSTPRVSVK